MTVHSGITENGIGFVERCFCASPFSLCHTNGLRLKTYGFLRIICIPFFISVFSLSQYLCIASGRRTKIPAPTPLVTAVTVHSGITENGIGFVERCFCASPFSLCHTNGLRLKTYGFLRIICIPFFISVFSLSQYLCIASGRRTKISAPTPLVTAVTVQCTKAPATMIAWGEL